MCKLCISVHTNRSSGAPSTDAVGDAMQSLPVVPFRELVVFGRRGDVCADHFDGKVRDFVVGYLGAVELGSNGQSVVTWEVTLEIEPTLATLYCRLLVR